MKKNIIISFALSTLFFSNFANAEITPEDYKISIEQIKSASKIKLENQNINIQKGGVYSFFGKLENKNITVDVKDDEVVKIILDGVDIKSSTYPAINIKNAKKTIISSSDGSKNYISDSLNNSETSAIYSKDDLVIIGNGLLEVQGNKKDAIKSNDELYLNANININALDDGIIGKDSIIVDGGTYKINSKGDGIKSTNTEDSKKGYIQINKGTFDITSYNDAIQTVTSLKINGGKFDIKTNGEKSKEISSKGLKANYLELNGGEFTINSTDDGINAKDSIVFNNGKFKISSKDDGVHAENKIIFNDGDLNVVESFESFEGNNIVINNGLIKLVSKDDALNASGDNPYLQINGGKILIDSMGDGIDVNGDMEMTGGTVLVNGPVERRNGAIDYDGKFKITGGFLIATGNSGMAETASENSTQVSVLIGLTPLSANTMIHIESKSGENILSFVPTKDYDSIAISSSSLKKDTEYLIYSGGNNSINSLDGLIQSEISHKGELMKTFLTSSNIITSDIEKKRHGKGKGGWKFW